MYIRDINRNLFQVICIDERTTDLAIMPSATKWIFGKVLSFRSFSTSPKYPLKSMSSPLDNE